MGTAGNKAAEYKTAAIVLAAGQGRRMNSQVQKQYLMLGEYPVIYYSLRAFEQSFVDEVVLVTGALEQEYCRKEIVEKYGFTKVRSIVAGGKERYHSVANGLRALKDCDYVFIHDGARPFLTQDILKRAYETVVQEKACVVGMPVKDTIKLADENGYAQTTPRRDLVWQIQTPQVFACDLIWKAYEKFLEQEQTLEEQGVRMTDDAMVAEYFAGVKVRLVEGSYENIKLTTPEDFKIAAGLTENFTESF